MLGFLTNGISLGSSMFASWVIRSVLVVGSNEIPAQRLVAPASAAADTANRAPTRRVARTFLSAFLMHLILPPTLFSRRARREKPCALRPNGNVLHLKT